MAARSRAAAEQLVHTVAVPIERRKVQAGVVAPLVAHEGVGAVGGKVLNAVGVPAQVQATWCMRPTEEVQPGESACRCMCACELPNLGSRVYVSLHGCMR